MYVIIFILATASFYIFALSNILKLRIEMLVSILDRFDIYIEIDNYQSDETLRTSIQRQKDLIKKLSSSIKKTFKMFIPLKVLMKEYNIYLEISKRLDKLLL